MKKMIRRSVLSAVIFLAGCLSACGSKTSSTYTGTWKAISYNDFGTMMSTTDLGETTMELKAGGAGTLSMMGDDSTKISWKENKDSITVNYGGTDLTGTMNGNVLIFGDEDLQAYLTKDGAEAKWSAEPTLETIDSIVQKATTNTVSLDDWYGKYNGILSIDEVFGTLDAEYKGEEDPVYGYISKDSVDFLELYTKEDFNSETDSPIFSSYISLYDSYFEVAGNDNWFGDMDFNASDNRVEKAVLTNTDPLTFYLTGTYYDPNGTTATSDGFQWKIAVAKTSDSTEEASPKPTSEAASQTAGTGKGNAGLENASFSGSTKTITGSGVTIKYPSSATSSINSVENPEVQFPKDIWVTAELINPALISYEDCKEYEAGYSSNVGYQLYESTYNGSKCIVMMHDGADNNDYEAAVEIQVYLDNGSCVSIFINTLDAPLSDMLGNPDIMATAANITW